MNMETNPFNFHEMAKTILSDHIMCIHVDLWHVKSNRKDNLYFQPSYLGIYLLEFMHRFSIKGEKSQYQVC